MNPTELVALAIGVVNLGVSLSALLALVWKGGAMAERLKQTETIAARVPGAEQRIAVLERVLEERSGAPRQRSRPDPAELR